MNVSDISLRDVAYVQAIARFKSFSRAAEHCAVSQPALSKQLKQLEASLGVPLFERSKRHVLMTPQGERFLKQAQIVMDNAEKLIRVTRTEQGPLSGSFRLGVIASACPYLLPYFIAQLPDAYPHLALNISEGLTERLVEDLRQGRLDAVIAATTFEDETLCYQPLFFEPFLLAARAEALADVETNKSAGKIDLDRLDTGKILLLEDGHCLKDQTTALCNIRQNDASLNFRATSVETLLQMTAGGLGVSVIPRLAVPQSQNMEKSPGLGHTLMFRQIKGQAVGRTMAMYYRSSYPATQDIVSLCQFIRDHLPESVQVLDKV